MVYIISILYNIIYLKWVWNNLGHHAHHVGLLAGGRASRLKLSENVPPCRRNVGIGGAFWVPGKPFLFVRVWGLGLGRVTVRLTVGVWLLRIPARVSGLRLLRGRSVHRRRLRRRIVGILRWRVGRGRFYTPVDPNPPCPLAVGGLNSSSVSTI